MRFQTTKTETIEARHNLPFSTLARRAPYLIKHTPHKNLKTLFQSLFKILPHKEKMFEPDKYPLAINEEETRSLQHLEDCANAARQTEAYSQDE